MTDVATIAAPATAPVASVGSLIDQYFDLREQLREVQAQEKEVKAAMAVVEEELIKLYDAQEITLCRGRRARASLTSQDIPMVKDWDEFYKYVLDNQAFHMLERRPATAACRELRDSGEEVPGVDFFTRRGISVTKL